MGDVVGVRMDGGQDFSRVRLTTRGVLDNDPLRNRESP
jgi:hypothetical protein